MVKVDPYRNFNFLVEIDGIRQAGFSGIQWHPVKGQPAKRTRPRHGFGAYSHNDPRF